MNFIEPKVFHIGQTTLDQAGFCSFLDELGIPEWHTDAPSDQEQIIEIGGKLCYMSFKAGLNPNVTKVTEDNRKYIGNILRQRHGSVIEHGVDIFILYNVSRILTHELVRHRAGTAFSQVSGRYVRAEELNMWFPTSFKNHKETTKIKEIVNRVGMSIEGGVRDLTDLLGFNEMSNFNLKKILTSAMRRIVPDGNGNHIMVTANHRAWRHMIEARTNEHAEEEIRLVFDMIYNQLKIKYPNIYQDTVLNTLDDGTFEVRFDNTKV